MLSDWKFAPGYRLKTATAFSQGNQVCDIEDKKRAPILESNQELVHVCSSVILEKERHLLANLNVQIRDQTLFPLNCRRRLARNVVDYSINPIDFVYNSHGNLL